MLQQQLDRVAFMIEQSPHFSNLEAYVWRRLSRHVDAPHFERTGQIIAPLVPPEELAGMDDTTSERISAGRVREALDTLMESGHLAVSHRAKQDHYRLVLPQSVVSSDEMVNG